MPPLHPVPLCCPVQMRLVLQALETFGDLGVTLVSVTMNYTAPAEDIYNIIISKQH